MLIQDFFKKEKEFKQNHKVQYFFRELWYEFRYRIIRRIRDAKMEVVWAYQRVFKGYDRTAHWGLYNYLTNIALPVLKDYRENMHGVPGIVCRKGEPLSKSVERWEQILDKMIYSFQAIHDDENFINPPDVEKKIQEGLKLFAKYFRTLWD